MLNRLKLNMFLKTKEFGRVKSENPNKQKFPFQIMLRLVVFFFIIIFIYFFY